MSVAEKRSRACAKFLAKVHNITEKEGATPPMRRKEGFRFRSFADRQAMRPRRFRAMPRPYL